MGARADKCKLVKEWIKSDDVVIFSKSQCPHCKRTKKIFNDLDQEYTVVELDSRLDCKEIQQVLGKLTGAKTVPRVFVHGEFIGGASDIKKLYEAGELQKYFD